MTEGADQQLLVGQLLGRMQTLREVLDRIDRTGVTILGEDLSDVAEHSRQLVGSSAGQSNLSFGAGGGANANANISGNVAFNLPPLWSGLCA